MKSKFQSIAFLIPVFVFLSGTTEIIDGQDTEVTLSAQGQEYEKNYAEQLDQIQKEIAKSLPSIIAKENGTFQTERDRLSKLNPPSEEADLKTRKKFEADRDLVEAKIIQSARSILNDAGDVLRDDKLDSKLLQGAILRHATPRGLAEFAQQGKEEKALLDQLFDNKSLMKQMLIAGGANGGEYGEAMQVYTAILKSSERARTPGILQRLALGTALHQPWLKGKNKGGVYGTVYTDHQTPDGQVDRYLHYEKAFLNSELDSAFKEMNVWECRFITNDPYSNAELSWARKMLRNFRPDHINNPNHSWRYVGLVKSDLPYCSTTHDESLGMAQQQALALGGVCGRRAFFGRFITRAFGIPARRSTQKGHAAMNFWTPDGWVVRLGAWWSMNWCGPQCGLDFYLDSQAREFPEQYLQVLRAQWIGDVLGEEEVSLRNYGRGGGFWNGLAFYVKRIIVEDSDRAQAAAESELATLTAEQARLLGESDKILGKTETKQIAIADEHKKIDISKNGVITVPAVACTGPKNNTEKVAFLKSWDEGMQIHYQRLGNRPEILRYSVNVPTAGKYKLTAKVATVSKNQNVIFRLNRRTLVNVTLPYTKGIWETSKPEVVELREGRNSIMLTFRAPNRGVSLKEFQLQPMK